VRPHRLICLTSWVICKLFGLRLAIHIILEVILKRKFIEAFSVIGVKAVKMGCSRWRAVRRYRDLQTSFDVASFFPIEPSQLSGVRRLGCQNLRQGIPYLISNMVVQDIFNNSSSVVLVRLSQYRRSLAIAKSSTYPSPRLPTH
jgi:hypothetical protein